MCDLVCFFFSSFILLLLICQFISIFNIRCLPHPLIYSLLVLVSLWAVYIQFPTGWNFVFPFLLLRLLFFLKIGGHFRQKCVFGSLLPLWLGLGPFWKEGNFHFVYKEGLVFFGCPINLLGREFGVPRIIYRDQERYFKGISLIFKNIIHSAFFVLFL